MLILAIGGPYASAPVTAPTGLSASSTTTTSTVISFTAPTNDGGAAITNYEYSTNGSTWTALSPADAASPVTITGLSSNTAYTIYLRAVNIVGSGPASSGVAVTTLAGAPTGLSTSSVTQTTATIAFTAPSGSATITNYEYSTNGSTWTALSPADAVTPVTVTGLTANTAYTIYLRAVNATGSGTASSGVAATTNPSTISIEYLVIAGGGSGAYNGGGGGAGGYRCSVSGELTGGGGAAESALSLGTGTYTVTVGAGGPSNQSSGSDSVFASITSTGGGGAGGDVGSNVFTAGKSGGSGGGGGNTIFGGGGAGLRVTNPVQGNDGAANNGGGGGAGSAASGGTNGSGRSSSITGAAVTRATGGHGSAGGGGGANTGNGSGGKQANQWPDAAGGSGIVIIRYLTSIGNLFTISGGTATTSGSYTIRTFTGSGSLTIS